MTRHLLAVAAAIALVGGAADRGSAQEPTPGEGPLRVERGCDLCHAELELLRQRVPTLEAARSLVVPSAEIHLSAHDTMSCASCHTGFDRFPHPLPDTVAGTPGAVSTESCTSCHAEVEEVWTGSAHEREDEGADCTACHGIHDVAPLDALAEGAGMLRMNATCVDCHDTSILPPSDPHADSIPCASCHAAHETEAVTAAGALVAPVAQYETCGSCHEEVADSARTDAHGSALRDADIHSLADLEHEGAAAPAACTSCHGSHGMLAPSHDRFDQDMVDQCAACHEDYADTYFGTYHGKATAVGSEIVATCDHCHGAHRVFPASVEESMVSDAKVEETCAACHDHVRPAFVEYDSHPDPMDRSRNAPLFYSFVFMNTILIGTLIVFGLHTLLWWVRLQIDRAKGVSHGPGADHG